MQVERCCEAANSSQNRDRIQPKARGLFPGPLPSLPSDSCLRAGWAPTYHFALELQPSRERIARDHPEGRQARDASV